MMYNKTNKDWHTANEQTNMLLSIASMISYQAMPIPSHGESGVLKKLYQVDKFINLSWTLNRIISIPMWLFHDLTKQSNDM